MQRIQQLPEQIREKLGHVEHIAEPPQGCTSTVLRVVSRTGDYIVKSTVNTLYSSWLEREYWLLQLLTKTPVKAPKPYAFYRDVIGGQKHCWLVMDCLEGESAGRALLQTACPDERAGILHGVGQALRTLHQTPAPAELIGQGDWLTEMLADAEMNLQNGDADGDATLLLWLKEQQLKSVQQCLIHGDFTVDNVLVKDGKVTGIIDWSGGAYGDPRYDLALFARPDQEEFHGTAELDAFYAGYGCETLSPEEMSYFVGLYEFF